MRDLSALEERIGYAFRDRALLERALTHTSYANENQNDCDGDSQRLEFLGDAVLNLAAAYLLMDRHPNAPEGVLTQMRGYLVVETSLARAGADLGLGDWLRLGRGEELTGGRKKPSLLADATEAIIGAAFVDGGFAPAREICERLLADSLADLAKEGDVWDDDYKSRLQEFAQAQGGESPRYALVSEEGPAHERQFEVSVAVGGRELGRGRGRTKRDAEQQAAHAGLDALKKPASSPVESP